VFFEVFLKRATLRQAKLGAQTKDAIQRDF